MAAKYYEVGVSAPTEDALRLERLMAYFKPIFRNAFSVVRNCSAQPLEALDHWPLSAAERRDHAQRMTEIPLLSADSLRID